MKIAVVFGARSNEIRSRLMQLQDNLYIDAFSTVGDMISSSVTRKYFYDRVVMISNAVNATGGQVTIDELCSYWRAHCQRTQLVMVCRAEVDDDLAKYFTSAFGSPLVTSMSVKSTSVMTLKEAAIEDIRELNSKYGIVFDTLAIVDEDAYEEPEPMPMPQENAMPEMQGQNFSNEGMQMMQGMPAEQQNGGMPINAEQSAPVKKKGLFGKLFGGGKKDHKNNKHQNNIPQANQGVPAGAMMSGMTDAVTGATEGMSMQNSQGFENQNGQPDQMYAGQTGFPEQTNQDLPYADDPMAAQLNCMNDESSAFPEQNAFPQSNMGMSMPEQQTFTPKFDPETGEPLNQAVEKQAFTPKFDPETGAPLNQVVEEQAFTPKFDPETGEPLNVGKVEQTSVPKFDSETGEPLTGYPQQNVSINPEEHQFEGAFDSFEQNANDFANQGTFEEQAEQSAFNQADFSMSGDAGMQEMPENTENQEFSDFSDNAFDTPTLTDYPEESGTNDTSSNDAFFDDFGGVDEATPTEDDGFGVEDENAESAFENENSEIDSGFASLDGASNMGENFDETPTSESDFTQSFEQENNEVAPEMNNFDNTDTADFAGENTVVGEDNFSMSGNNVDSRAGMSIGGAVAAEPTDEELIAKGYKFHPETGRPLVAAQKPQYKFDPETGRPLNVDASVQEHMNQMAQEVPQTASQGMQIPNEEVVEDLSAGGMLANNNFEAGMQEQQDDVDTDFSDMSVGDLEASYREKLEQPKVQIVEKEVIKEVVKEVQVGGRGANSVYGSILKGKTKKIILVTGDRGSGVTSLAYEIAEWFAKYVPVLYFDCDVELHGLLSYIDYHDFCQYDQQQLQGVKLCRSAKAFPNCITRYSSNLDLLTTNYGAEVSDEELELAQSVVAEVANNYGVVVVDAPIDKLPHLTDLILCGNTCLLAEASKRGMMNIMCKLEDSPLPTRYKRNLAGTGTMVYTKVNPKINMKKLIDYVKDIVDFEEVNWIGMNTINRPAKLDQKFIEEIIEA